VYVCLFIIDQAVLGVYSFVIKEEYSNCKILKLVFHNNKVFKKWQEILYLFDTQFIVVYNTDIIFKIS